MNESAGNEPAPKRELLTSNSLKVEQLPDEESFSELESLLRDPEFQKKLEEEQPGLESGESILHLGRAHEEAAAVAEQATEVAEKEIFASSELPENFGLAAKASLERTALHRPEEVFSLEKELAEHEARKERLARAEAELAQHKAWLDSRAENRSQTVEEKGERGKIRSALRPALSFLGSMFRRFKEGAANPFPFNDQEPAALDKVEERDWILGGEPLNNLRQRKDQIEDQVAKAEDARPLLQMQIGVLESSAEQLMAGQESLQDIVIESRERALAELLELMKKPDLKSLEKAQEYLDRIPENESAQFFEHLNVPSTVSSEMMMPLRSKEDIQSELNLLLQAQLNTDLDNAIERMSVSSADGFYQLSRFLERILMKDRLGSKDKSALERFVFKILELKMHDFDEKKEQDREKAARLRVLINTLKPQRGQPEEISV